MPRDLFSHWLLAATCGGSLAACTESAPSPVDAATLVTWDCCGTDGVLTTCSAYCPAHASCNYATPITRCADGVHCGAYGTDPHCPPFDAGMDGPVGHFETYNCCSADQLVDTCMAYCPMPGSCNYGASLVPRCADGVHCLPLDVDASCAPFDDGSIDAGAAD